MKILPKLPKFYSWAKYFKKIFSWSFWPLLIVFTLPFLPGNSYYETLLPGSRPIVLVDHEKVLPPLPALPVQSLKGNPVVDAQAVMLVDYDSGQILYQKNPDQTLAPASLSKIMTALVVLEEIPLDQIITVGDFWVLGQIVGLSTGEQFMVNDLLYSLLVMSGNDTAYALAEAYPGGQSAFVARMNDRAKELGLENTNFVNPHGLDHPDHYTTAKDLLRLVNYALRNDTFAEIIKRGNGQICNLAGDHCYQIETTNELLDFPGMLGVKTGRTDQAGECFIGFWEQDDRRFLSIILGSDNRFWETQNLLAWGLVSFSNQPISLINFLD